MFSLSLLNLNHCPFIPSHSHKVFQLCLLLRGRMEIWRAVGSAVQRSSFVTGDIWAVPAGELHSAKVDSGTLLLCLRYARPNSRLIGAATVSAALSALLSLEAAHACNIDDLTTTHETCDYTLEDLERDKQTGLRLEVPDCFFATLESAAAGGDSQAQVDLGISLMEGLSDDPGDSALGSYWLKRAAESGHPSAMSILDAYMEDLAC